MSKFRGQLSSWVEAHATWLCIGVTIIGALLRLYDLGTRSLWFDEAIEVLIARQPLGNMQATGIAWVYTHPPLASWLLHFALKLGSSDAIARLPSFLFGVAAVYASYHLFRLWVDAPIALAAQFFLALAPAQVYYSQDANPYSMMVAMSVLIYWAFEKTVRQTSWRNLITFATLSVIGLFTHYGIAWFLIVLAAMLTFRQKPRDWLRWLPAGVIIGIAGLILYTSVIEPQFQRIQTAIPSPPPKFDDLISVANLRTIGPDLLDTIRLFTDFGGRYVGQPSIITWFFLIVFLIGTVRSLAKRDLRPVVLILLLSIFLTFLASQYGLYYWGWRYLLFLSPIFYLLLAIGLHADGNLNVLSIAGIAMAILILLANQIYPGWPNGDGGEHLRPIVQRVQNLVAPGDGIYVYYGARPAFLVYYSGTMENVRFGWWFREQPLPQKMSDIVPFVTSHQHTWFLASHMGEGEVNAILESLDRICARVIVLNQPGALGAEYDCSSRLESDGTRN